MFLFGPPNIEKMKACGDVPGLIKALEYKARASNHKAEIEIRHAAARALVEIGAPTVEPLLVALRNEDMSVRYRAAYALGDIGDPRAVEPLIAALKDKKWDVRRAAATALGKMGDSRAVEPLLAMLNNDREDQYIQKACVEALGKIGDLRTVEPLVRALQIWGLSKAAATALDQLDWRPGQDETAVRYWIAKQEWEQCAALGSVAIETCVSLLEQSARNGALAQSMLDPSPFGYLGAAGGGEAWMLGDECVEMREAAVKALSRMGASAVPLLIERLQEPDAWMRMTFAWALGELKDARAVEPLMALLRDEKMFADDYEPCDCAPQAIAEALVKIGAPSVEPLIAELMNKNPKIRKLVIWTLGEIQDSRAVEPLTALLEDKDWAIRLAADKALEKLMHRTN